MKKIKIFDIVVTILNLIIMSMSVYFAYDNLLFLLIVPGCIGILFYTWHAVLERNLH